MFFANLNYWVILIAAILGMGVGFIWHAEWAFGALWIKAKGWDSETMRSKNEGKSMIPVYIATFVTLLVTAFIIATIFNSLVVVGFGGIFLTTVLLWLGFSVPMKAYDYLFGGDSFTLFLLEIGHQLVALVVMSVIIGIFG